MPPVSPTSGDAAILGYRDNAAIPAADVVGYSIGASGHRRDLIDPTIASHRDHSVKTTGDGMLVEFASAVGAVRCAVFLYRFGVYDTFVARTAGLWLRSYGINRAVLGGKLGAHPELVGTPA